MGLALGGRDFSTSAFRRRRQKGCSMRCAASSAAGSTLPQRGARLFIYYKFGMETPLLWLAGPFACRVACLSQAHLLTFA